MTVREKIKNILIESLQEAISSGSLPEADYPEVKIEYPREEKFGDYSTPLAMESAKILKRSPLEIANSIKPFIEKHSMITQVDVVKPGFINIFLSVGFLTENLKFVDSCKEIYGKVKNENPLRINIEFVSANPTGPMNVVSARAAALGDTIANLLCETGHSVHKEFYVNDYGNQVNLLGQSVYARIKEIQGESIEFPEDGYQGEYIKDIAQHIIDTYVDELVKLDNDELLDFISKKAIEYNVSGQKKDLEKFNVTFDQWFHEKLLHESQEVDNVLDEMQKKNTIYKDEEKLFFRSTDFGDDKDRVVKRDDGRPTYLLADIAYHKNKIDRNFDLLIDIWGPDHHGYIARMKGAMEVFGYNQDTFKVLIAQQVNLIMEGETVKMSKRLGKFSTMKDLLEEIGTDVARYFFVMRSLDSHLDFDLALAKKESSENPVFYIQYANARINSTFKKAVETNVEIDHSKINSSFYENSESMQLLKMIARYPEEIIDAAIHYEPHRLCNFLLKLAGRFHKFYTEHRIITDDIIQTNTFHFLISCVQVVIKNGLRILGISAPDKM